MRRKAVTQRVASARRLRRLLQDTRGELGRKLSSRPAAMGREPLCYQPVFDHLVTELETVEQRLDEIEDAYADALAAVRSRRTQRDVAALVLRERQVFTRKVLAGLPTPRLEQAGITSTTPQALPALAHQARLTVDLLRDLTADESAPAPGFTIRGDVLAEELEAALKNFAALQSDLDEERCVAAELGSRSKPAMAEYDCVSAAIGRCLESYCQLVGATTLSSRFRKLRSRRSSTPLASLLSTP